MNSLLQLNNRGVSLMVGYVILIVIAIALASAVFFYLKLYLPPEKPTCPADIDLVIDEATCTIAATVPTAVSNIEIKFSNKGLFSIDATYIKIGDVDRILRTTLNNPDQDRMFSSCNNFVESKLKPGAQFCGLYTYESAPSTVQEISVEPLVWIDNIPVLCPESIVTKRITCS